MLAKAVPFLITLVAVFLGVKLANKFTLPVVG